MPRPRPRAGWWLRWKHRELHRALLDFAAALDDLDPDLRQTRGYIGGKEFNDLVYLARRLSQQTRRVLGCKVSRE